LTIKQYYLVTPTHVVHIPSLLYIRPAREVVRRIGLEQYGLSITSILWAGDWRRGGSITGPLSGYEKSFVIKAKGDWLRRGFSVEDRGQFFWTYWRGFVPVSQKLLWASRRKLRFGPRWKGSEVDVKLSEGESSQGQRGA
jgi:hypothetical protein